MPACQSIHPDTEKLDQIVGLDSLASELRFVVLIPVSGCGSCVDKTVAFSEKHLHDSRFLVVASGTDYKSTANHFADSLRAAASLRIETQGRVSRLSASSPMVFELEEKAIKNSWTIDYETADSIFSEIERSLR